MKTLITSATDPLSSPISFPNCYNTTVDSIIVKYEATNMTPGTGKYTSGNAIYSETAQYPVTQPEEEVYTES